MSLRDLIRGDESPRRIVWALFALVALAAALRFIGIGCELPEAREADTAIVHYAAWAEQPAGAKMNDAVYPSTIYPFLFGGLLCVLPGSSNPLAASTDAPLNEHLHAAALPYLRARWLIAFVSLLLVPATYGIARHWLSREWSLLAAAFAATSALAHDLAVQARPHGALAGLNALALFALLRLVRERSIWAYLAAGAASALSLSALHSGCFVTPALALAHWIGWRRDRDHARWWKFACAVLVTVVAFVLAYPFLVSGGLVRNETKGTLDFGMHSIRLDSWNGDGFALIPAALFGHDPVLCTAAVIGLCASVWSLLRHRGFGARGAGPALVVALHAAITVLAFGLQAQLYPRFMLPLVPLCAVLAAYGVWSVGTIALSWLRDDSSRRAALTVLSITVLAFPTFVCVRFTRMRQATDTQTLAADWLRENAARVQGPIAVDFVVSLPLREQRETITAIPGWFWTPWMRYQVETMPADATLESWPLRRIWAPGMLVDRKVDAAEVERFVAEAKPHWIVVSFPTKRDAENNEVRAWARARARDPVVRFVGDERILADWESTTGDADFEFVRHVLPHRRAGPTIEIYELP